VANFVVRYLRVAAWNLFWCDYARSVNFRRGILGAYLQIAKLSKLFSTIVKSTRERLDLLVHDLVSANIASLRKSLSADIAAVGSLPSVSPLVSLGVGQQ
jgi:hypothetical protein